MTKSIGEANKRRVLDAFEAVFNIQDEVMRAASLGGLPVYGDTFPGKR